MVLELQGDPENASVFSESVVGWRRPIQVRPAPRKRETVPSAVSIALRAAHAATSKDTHPVCLSWKRRVNVVAIQWIARFCVEAPAAQICGRDRRAQRSVLSK